MLSARKVLRGDSFDLHIRENGKAAFSRLGLVVPKRLARQACLRNAIKRQGREAFRQLRGPVTACDIVIRLKRPVTKKPGEAKLQRQNWRREIESLMDRLAARVI